MDSQFGEMLDTTPEARATYYELLARLSPEARARKVVALGRAARALARAGIRLQRPDASAGDVERELVVRLYGEDAAAYLTPYLFSEQRG